MTACTTPARVLYSRRTRSSCSTSPTVRPEARNRRSEVKRHDSPQTCVGCGLVLLSVFLFATTATGQLAVTPSTVAFGSVQIGSSVSQSVGLNNTGNENLKINQATVVRSAFSISGLNMPLTLAPGQSVSFTTIFAPQSSGSMSGSVSLQYSRAYGRRWGRATVSLTGTGTNQGQ